jgi:MoxR-like ATPase
MSEIRRSSPESMVATKEKNSKRLIEVAPDSVKIAGVKIERSPEAGPRTPPAERFADFSEDEFSLNILQTIAKSVSLDQPLLLEGEVAVGKSYTIEYIAHLCNKEVYRMSLNGQTDTSDLIGKWVPRTETVRKKIESLIKTPALCKSGEAKELIETKTRTAGFTKEELEIIATLEGIEPPEGDWVWQDGDIPKQMKNGAWSVLDEVNTCEPQILVRLNALLEKGGQLILSEDGSKVVTRHKDFKLFATVNPPGGRYKGRIPLSAEWISRWNYQNVGDLPKEVRAQRLMVADGVPAPGIKQDRIKMVQNEEIPAEKTLADYFGAEWVRDLYTKYAEFADKVREMLRKGEIAKDQTQTFDFDQRDDWRFREYIRKFHEPGRMKETIQDAIIYCFANKCKNAADRKKILDLMKLINVTEPKLQSAEGEEGGLEDAEIASKLGSIKKDLVGMDLPADHKDILFGKELAVPELAGDFVELQKRLSDRRKIYGIVAPTLEVPDIPEGFTSEHQKAMAEIFGENNLELILLPSAEQITADYLEMMYPKKQSSEDNKTGLINKRGDWWDNTADAAFTISEKEEKASGGKKKRAAWGELYIASMKSEAAQLEGSLLFSESIQKPKYKDGSQQYGTKEGDDADKDPLLPIIKEVFGEKANRFNLSWDEITTKLIPKVKEKIQEALADKHLSVPKFEVILTPAVVSNLQTTLNHPENSQTNTYEWTSTILLKQDGTDSGNRLLSGDSERGGAGFVNSSRRGNRWFTRGVRLSVVFDK